MQWHPKFKKKSKAESKFYMDTDKIAFSDTHVKLEKIANSKKKNRAKINWIKLAEVGRVPNDVKYINPRVKCDGIHWWISIGIEYGNHVATAVGEGVGVDLGIKELCCMLG